MKQPNVAVYGSRACPDTTRALQWLDSHQVQYEFKDLDESPELNARTSPTLNNGKRVTPTIQIDNEILINPSDKELNAGHPAGLRRAALSSSPIPSVIRGRGRFLPPKCRREAPAPFVFEGRAPEPADSRPIDRTAARWV